MSKMTVRGKSPYSGRERLIEVRESFSDKVRRICQIQFDQTGTSVEEAAVVIGRHPSALQEFMDGGDLAMDLFEEIWAGTRFETPEQFLALDDNTENIHSYRDKLVVDLHHTLSDKQLKRVHDIACRANALGILEPVLTSAEMMISGISDDLGRPNNLQDLRRSQYETNGKDSEPPGDPQSDS